MLFTGSTVQEVYAELDRMVARLHEQGINPATFEWFVVDEGRNPVVLPGVH